MDAEHTTYLMDEVLHFGLQAPPLELDRDQFVGAHDRAFAGLLFLLGEQQKERRERKKKTEDLHSTTF